MSEGDRDVWVTSGFDLAAALSVLLKVEDCMTEGMEYSTWMRFDSATDADSFLAGLKTDERNMLIGKLCENAVAHIFDLDGGDDAVGNAPDSGWDVIIAGLRVNVRGRFMSAENRPHLYLNREKDVPKLARCDAILLCQLYRDGTKHKVRCIAWEFTDRLAQLCREIEPHKTRHGVMVHLITRDRLRHPVELLRLHWGAA